MEETVILKENLFIGQGHHKKAYVHPKDSSKCIKVVFVEPDVDVTRELSYRHTRDRRHLTSSILTHYYGTVNTNQGIGYVHEIVQNFDGTRSQTLSEYIEEWSHKQNVTHTLIDELIEFRNQWIQEEVLITTDDPVNFLVQRIDENHNTIRIIDNIGTHEHIPISCYVSYFAHKKIKRYWKRMVLAWHSTYPSIFTDVAVAELLNY